MQPNCSVTQWRCLLLLDPRTCRSLRPRYTKVAENAGCTTVTKAKFWGEVFLGILGSTGLMATYRPKMTCSGTAVAVISEHGPIFTSYLTLGVVPRVSQKSGCARGFFLTKILCLSTFVADVTGLVPHTHSLLQNSTTQEIIDHFAFCGFS